MVKSSLQQVTSDCSDVAVQVKLFHWIFKREININASLSELFVEEEEIEHTFGILEMDVDFYFILQNIHQVKECKCLKHIYYIILYYISVYLIYTTIYLTYTSYYIDRF